MNRSIFLAYISILENAKDKYNTDSRFTMLKTYIKKVSVRLEEEQDAEGI